MTGIRRAASRNADDAEAATRAPAEPDRTLHGVQARSLRTTLRLARELAEWASQRAFRSDMRAKARTILQRLDTDQTLVRELPPHNPSPQGD